MAILVIQAILAVVIIIGILLQHRAAGLSAVFGGGGNVAVTQRRGAEKFLFQLTWAACALFALLTVVQWYV